MNSNEFDVNESNEKLDKYLLSRELLVDKITHKRIKKIFLEFKESIRVVLSKRYKKERRGVDDLAPFEKFLSIFHLATFTENQQLIDLFIFELQAINKKTKKIKYYFIKASQIREVLNEINESDFFRIDSYKAFKNIEFAMILKLNAYLISVFFDYEHIISPLDDILEKQKRRLIKNKVALQDEDDFIFKKAQEFALKMVQQYDSKKGDLRFIKDTISGVHSAIFLQEIYHKNIINIKSSTAKEKNIIFYPLLKLVEIEKPLYDFQDFRNSDYAITSKTLETKKKAFNRYMNKQVINFLSIKK